MARRQCSNRVAWPIEIDGEKEPDPNKLIRFRLNQQHRLKIGRKKFAIVEWKPESR